MRIIRIIRNISFIFISSAILNESNPATISFNLINNMQNKYDNENNTITKYKYIITYKESDGNQVQFSFSDFDNTNDKIINEINEKFDENITLTGLKSYAISIDGDYTLDLKKTFNIKKEFGLPVNASNLLLVLHGVSISSNVENISIINNSKIFKPIIIVYYDELNFVDNLTIKCLRIPYIKLQLNNIKKYYKIFKNYLYVCKIKSIESLSRYSVFQFNLPIEIDKKLYTAKEKIVVKGKKIIPYDEVFWN